MIELVEEAVASGARQAKACEVLGISERTLQRWRKEGLEDQRRGPDGEPANKLSAEEREIILQTVNAPEYRDLSPHQIVVKLADEGSYLCSESTMYRILAEEDQLRHREWSKPPEARPVVSHEASGPNEVWSWDITWLPASVRGRFWKLYLVEDIWSRRIMAWEVHERESSRLAAALVEGTCAELGIDAEGLSLHSDNGGPMKGSTMLATLQRLGVTPSFSRPGVCDDNPFPEALFRTLKYRPEYPEKPFSSIEEARQWVGEFVEWYNGEHLHSGIRFVTPDDRHFGREAEILAQRRRVYEQARRRNPERWSGTCRNWQPVEKVYLNPEIEEEVSSSSQMTTSEAA